MNLMSDSVILTFEISPAALAALTKMAKDKQCSTKRMAQRLLYKELWGGDADALVDQILQDREEDFRLSIPVRLNKSEIEELRKAAASDGIELRKAARLAILRELRMRRLLGDKFDAEIWRRGERAGLDRFIGNAERTMTIEEKR
jgi:hypothetical protein